MMAARLDHAAERGCDGVDPDNVVDSICPQANALDLDTLIKTMDLDAWRIYCREQ